MDTRLFQQKNIEECKTGWGTSKHLCVCWGGGGGGAKITLLWRRHLQETLSKRGVVVKNQGVPCCKKNKGFLSYKKTKTFLVTKKQRFSLLQNHAINHMIQSIINQSIINQSSINQSSINHQSFNQIVLILFVSFRGPNLIIGEKVEMWGTSRICFGTGRICVSSIFVSSFKNVWKEKLRNTLSISVNIFLGVSEFSLQN